MAKAKKSKIANPSAGGSYVVTGGKLKQTARTEQPAINRPNQDKAESGNANSGDDIQQPETGDQS